MWPLVIILRSIDYSRIMKAECRCGQSEPCILPTSEVFIVLGTLMGCARMLEQKIIPV